MDKPTTVARQEFMDALVQLINDSNLPPFVLAPILEGVTRQIADLERQQYEKELAEYNDALSKEKENENDG